MARPDPEAATPFDATDYRPPPEDPPPAPPPRPLSRREELVLLVALAVAALVVLVLPVSADALIDLARYLARPGP